MPFPTKLIKIINAGGIHDLPEKSKMHFLSNPLDFLRYNGYYRKDVKREEADYEYKN